LLLTCTVAEDVVGWARNMEFQRNSLQVRDGKLLLEKQWYAFVAYVKCKENISGMQFTMLYL
jgi:hypothetical protein